MSIKNKTLFIIFIFYMGGNTLAYYNDEPVIFAIRLAAGISVVNYPEDSKRNFSSNFMLGFLVPSQNLPLFYRPETGYCYTNPGKHLGAFGFSIGSLIDIASISLFSHLTVGKISGEFSHGAKFGLRFAFLTFIGFELAYCYLSRTEYSNMNTTHEAQILLIFDPTVFLALASS